MSEHQIVPDKVTKPIQLLAAWLVGLIVVNASFLLAAQQIAKPDWASSALVIAAISNVPIFIIALFLLQTKFRPQMQEDSYYSQYLERERYQTLSSPNRSPAIAEQEVNQATERLVKDLGLVSKSQKDQVAEVLRESQKSVLLHKHGGSRTLSELLISPADWKDIATEFGNDKAFIQDIEGLIADGLIARTDNDNLHISLTTLGREIAERAQRENLLFSQKKPDAFARRKKHMYKTIKRDGTVVDNPARQTDGI